MIGTEELVELVLSRGLEVGAEIKGESLLLIPDPDAIGLEGISSFLIMILESNILPLVTFDKVEVGREGEPNLNFCIEVELARLGKEFERGSFLILILSTAEVGTFDEAPLTGIIEGEVVGSVKVVLAGDRIGWEGWREFVGGGE